LDETSDDPLPVVCTECQVDLGGMMQVTNRLLRLVRRLAELPGGTLIVCPEDIGKITPRGITRFPGLIFAVALDSWDPSWPEDVLATYDPLFPDSVFRIIGELPFAGPDREGRNIPASLVTVWSLAWPNDPPTTALFPLFPSTFSPTIDQLKRLNVASRVFLNPRDPRGRRRGSGRFETAQDFESAVFSAVATLWGQGRRITEDNVGKYLIAKRGRNRTAGDSPADPGRQFREWCTRFGFNPQELLQRAIAACANRE
jgi:hypothetical protein